MWWVWPDDEHAGTGLDRTGVRSAVSIDNAAFGPAGRIWSAMIAAVALQGCTLVGVAPSSPSLGSGDVPLSEIPDAVPKAEVKSRSGNPETYEIDGTTYRVMETSDGYRERGIASWYGDYFHGRRTSSGDTYDMYKMTAAHKTLPLPTYVRVTNLENGRTVVLRVNDRGPFVEGRIIDLSYVAAQKLGMAESGTARVEVEALDPPASRRAGEIAR